MEELERCKTRYPILLLHGVNCRDEKPIAYFGRIPAALRQRGATVYTGGQDAWGTIEGNALLLQARLEEMLEAEHCEKVNIIAHSKGGIEARYLISELKQAHRVASLTTVSTPHHGAKTASFWAAYRWLLCSVGAVNNVLWRAMGDKHPNFAQVITSLTAQDMADFNARHPDAPDLYYQSWGASLNQSRDDWFMRFSRGLLFFWDGETDGLVSPQSAQWGNYRGTIEQISHRDIIDCRKKELGHFSVVDFYTKMVEELREMGF